MKNLFHIVLILLISNTLLATPFNNGDNPTPSKKSITIKRGTIITLQLMDDVNSLDVETDNTIEMMVLVGVEKDGQTLIQTGTYAEGRISRARRAGVFGRGAYIELEGTSIRTADGQRIPISSVKTAKRGKGRKVLAVGASIALPAIGITMGTPILLPFAAIGLVMKGKEVEVNKGTLLRAKLKYDVVVTIQ